MVKNGETTGTYMTGQEFRAILATLGLSIRSGAKFLHTDIRTCRRYANDTVSRIPWDTAALLRVMATHKIAPETVRDLTERASKP